MKEGGRRGVLRGSLLLLVRFLLGAMLMRAFFIFLRFLAGSHRSPSIKAIWLEPHLHTMWLLSNGPWFVFCLLSDFNSVWDLNFLIQNKLMLDGLWR